jgi:hypothetical protein
MRRNIRSLLPVVVVGAFLAAATAASAAMPLSSGEARTLLSLPSGNAPEGIAVDTTGGLYVGNRRVVNGLLFSEILKMDVDGTVSTFASLPASVSVGPLGTSGVLGLTIDRHGTVYAALVTFEASTHGVWRISADGSALLRLAGSEQILFPNGLTFDAKETLYVTDSLAGAVWRFVGDAAGTLWLQDELLEPLPFDPLGVPLVGANGIAFSPPDDLYVANTERGLIARIPIALGNGSAGEPTVAAQAFELLTVDGIAADATGDLHAVVPGYAVLGTSPLVRVDSRTGSIVRTLNTSELAEFDVPLSITFGAGALDHQSVFVTNGDLPLVPGGPGAGVVQVGVGVPGFPIH